MEKRAILLAKEQQTLNAINKKFKTITNNFDRNRIAKLDTVVSQKKKSIEETINKLSLDNKIGREGYEEIVRSIANNYEKYMPEYIPLYIGVKGKKDITREPIIGELRESEAIREESEVSYPTTTTTEPYEVESEYPPSVLEKAMKKSREPEEIREIIRKSRTGKAGELKGRYGDEDIDALINIYSRMGDILKLIESKSEEKDEYKPERIEELVKYSPESVLEIEKDIDTAFAKGEMSKDEYKVLKASIPEELKHVKLVKKYPKQKVTTKEIKDVIRQRKQKKGEKRIKFI